MNIEQFIKQMRIHLNKVLMDRQIDRQISYHIIDINIMLKTNKYHHLLLMMVVIALVAYSQTPKEDEVHFPVPGYIDHKWYSGYLSFDMGKFHYVFFESQKDPDNDPLLLWLNGGPGCSSLIGMVYENGPFVFNKPGSANLQLNEFAWNKRANLLYIQSPGGVGFSHGLRNNNNSDETVARDNLQALLAFFDKFPTMKKNDFYISGESYAGVYVPTLAYQITKYNKLPSKRMSIKLKGIMVGNACTDPRQCWQPGADANVSIYQYQYLYNHGYYTEQQYDFMRAACLMGYHGKACNEIRDRLDKKFGETNTSLLNIYLPCYYDKMAKLNSQGKRYKQLQSGKKLDLADFVDCDDHVGIDNFFNQLMMHEYLHVDPIHFEMCSDKVADGYHVGENQSYYLYPLLMQEKLRIWVYSGDLDADVPITGTLTWLKRLREDYHIPVEVPWREWWVKGVHAHEDQVGGMMWGLRGLTFASVRGAGHMVPKDQKQSAFVLVNSFLDGVQLPDIEQ